MFTSIRYVLTENFQNLYRIYCIAKYELLADMRDSKFGIFWNFASPAIQVLTYWWFIQPCIQSGCSAVFSKTSVITKMKFPVSVLPATICAKEFFNHLCMLVIAFVTLALCGYTPNMYWFGLFYYGLCAFIFAESVSLILSVLTMLWRDVRKLITSLMRMLMYFSPVIWECHFADSVPHHNVLNFIMKLNPIYYIVNGYRDSVFYGKVFWDHPALTAYFWCFTLVLFVIGCMLMYKFKRKFIDLI